jgi:hypothetical protein
MGSNDSRRWTPFCQPQNRKFQLGLTRLNRQGATPAPVGGAGEFAKGIAKIAKNPRRLEKMQLRNSY